MTQTLKFIDLEAALACLENPKAVRAFLTDYAHLPSCAHYPSDGMLRKFYFLQSDLQNVSKTVEYSFFFSLLKDNTREAIIPMR